MIVTRYTVVYDGMTLGVFTSEQAARRAVNAQNITFFSHWTFEGESEYPRVWWSVVNGVDVQIIEDIERTTND